MAATYLAEDFFLRDVVTVARDLIGCEVRVRHADGVRAGRIVEAEAYGGTDDPASHAGRGPTPRSAIMFGPPAVVYVYLVYGMHHCLNFVTGPEGSAGAVLIRALEPLAGREAMAAARGLDPAACADRQLTAGPGRLCAALGLDLGWNGRLLTDPDSGIAVAARATPVAARDILAGPRVGITRAVERPWRFRLSGSRCLTD